MKFNELYRALAENKYYIFSFKDILSFFPAENKSNLEKRIYTWRKKGWIANLKKGLYELTYPENLIIPDLCIANHLYGPSYISLQTALSSYSVIPEVSMAVTSITTKPTRNFKNRYGLFVYRTIKPEYFTGYKVIKQDKFEILIAEPEKAIIDLLYFNKEVNFKEERFEREIVGRMNKRKLNYYAKLCNLKLEGLNAYLRGID